MKAIIERLVADLKWRLSKAGRKHAPKAKERLSWAAPNIPRSVPWLIWGAYMAYALLGAGALLALIPPVWGWLHTVVFSWPGWILSFILLFEGAKLLNRNFEVRAYAGLLRRNERFTLVEYAKYLNRQIQRANEDQAIGGPAEVARLRELRNRLHELLRKGAGEEILKVGSALAEEVDLAEAVVQAYEPLEEEKLFADLDERLPGELRRRIEALDLEVEQSHETRRELEG